MYRRRYVHNSVKLVFLEPVSKRFYAVILIRILLCFTRGLECSFLHKTSETSSWGLWVVLF